MAPPLRPMLLVSSAITRADYAGPRRARPSRFPGPWVLPHPRFARVLAAVRNPDTVRDGSNPHHLRRDCIHLLISPLDANLRQVSGTYPGRTFVTFARQQVSGRRGAVCLWWILFTSTYPTVLPIECLNLRVGEGSAVDSDVIDQAMKRLRLGYPVPAKVPNRHTL
jgi:hypothetical protein